MKSRMISTTLTRRRSETAGALVMTAVGDAREVARRARAYQSANVRKRAAIEVEEAEVILRKAYDERERIREAHRTTIALLAALRPKASADDIGNSYRDYYRYPQPDQGSNVTATADRVDRISAILTATDRNIAMIEQIVATLQDLEIPGRLCL